MGDSPLTVIVRRVVVVGYQARGAGIGVNVVGSRGQVGVMVLARGNIDSSRRLVSQFSDSEAFSGDSPLTAGKCGEIVGYQSVGGGIVGEVVEGGEQATMVHQVRYEVLEVKAAKETMEGTGLGWKV